MGDDLRQRRFTRARRTPEDDGAGIVTLDLQPQRLARADDMLLADELVERPRTHAVGQRPRAAVLLVRHGLEQAHTLKDAKTLPRINTDCTDHNKSKKVSPLSSSALRESVIAGACSSFVIS